jgi:hypothetical protein
LRPLAGSNKVSRYGITTANGLGQTFGHGKMKEALQVAADRSAITSVINFA